MQNANAPTGNLIQEAKQSRKKEGIHGMSHEHGTVSLRPDTCENAGKEYPLLQLVEAKFLLTDAALLGGSRVSRQLNFL